VELTIRPLTSENWQDLVTLFNESAVTRGCYCTYFRQSRKEYQAHYGEGNRDFLKAIVDAGEVPGLLAYDADRAVGWVSLAPRPAFPLIEHSRLLKPVDSQPVWSVVCFFISKTHRRQNLTLALLRAALDYARQKGAQIVEGYPVSAQSEQDPNGSLYTGIVSTFLEAGFVEVARRSDRRPILRITFSS
jgi:GNAT superfamily N-acetyltransferase